MNLSKLNTQLSQIAQSEEKALLLLSYGAKVSDTYWEKKLLGAFTGDKDFHNKRSKFYMWCLLISIADAGISEQ